MNKTLEVTAAVIRRNGLVLIGKRRAADYCGGLWEFPGGKIEPGESPEECLKRELAEELGIECAVGELLIETLHAYPDRAIRISAFLADILSGEPAALEHDEIRWVKPEDLPSYAFVPADLPIVDRIIQKR
ncbi:MAG: 8-oxo-dGTP diphosphatase MutT [Spirochaetales bacterium]|nr:8-oxo-dGTP diphosphatase MutT [Spirochaetales bacterium]